MSGRVALVYSDAYAAYRHADWHPLQPRRVALAVEQMRASGLLEFADLVAPRIASDAELALVHAPSYVDIVRKLGLGGRLSPTDVATAVRSGFAHGDNPPFSNMHEAGAVIAGGSLVAADLVASGRCLHAFNPAGGLHHAMRHLASGFCVYNDVAVAVAHLKALGHRVAVIDVDVHHGDGTQAAFYLEADVLTISLHQVGPSFFPGTGFPDEVGEGAGRGAAANLAMPALTWDEPWLRAFEAVVPELVSAFRPTVLVTQDGCDTHALDPLANMLCSTRIWPVIGRTFHRLAHDLCSGRWVALGGGGYAVEEVVPRAWTLLFAEMVGHPELTIDLLDQSPLRPAADDAERVERAIDQSLAELRRSLIGATARPG